MQPFPVPSNKRVFKGPTGENDHGERSLVSPFGNFGRAYCRCKFNRKLGEPGHVGTLLLTKENNQRYGTLRQIQELGLAADGKWTKSRRQSFQETEPRALHLHCEAKTRNDNVRKYCQRLYNDKRREL
jgi:hypothetical protein